MALMHERRTNRFQIIDTMSNFCLNIINKEGYMKQKVSFLLSLSLILLVSGYAFAQELIIYPAKGQSNEQMEKDKFECYSWAKGQTGFDPMQAPTASAPAPQKQSQGSVAGGTVKGALGGALLGAGIGAIAGDTKKGAAIGGLSGGAIGGVRSSRQKQEDERAQQQWEQQQVSEYSQKRNSYNRAYGACLEGRGYTVK